MNERPDQWYLDALEAKQRRQLRALVIAHLIPRVACAVALIALLIIAWKL